MPTPIIFFTLAVIAILVFIYFVPLNLWITAVFSGVQIDLLSLVFMRIRKSPVKEIVNSLIVATKGGLSVDLVQLESHALATGSPSSVVKTLLLAKQRNIDVTFQEVAAWDLAKWNMEEKLQGKANASSDDQLKIEILNRVKVLSAAQLMEVKRLMDHL